MWETSARALVPIGPASGNARLYVCGITPYDATHLGHAFTYLTFDMVQRVWRDLGLQVSYTQNITDVDDPLLERATATGVDWQELAASQIDLFRSDMRALRVIPPDHWVAVTEEIDLIVAAIADLAMTGLAYQVDDEYRDWYVASTSVPGYGDVAHLDPEDQLTFFAARGGDPQRPGKHHPLDTLVWRMARPGEPSWPSVLGTGRPGWHIECTAIAQRYLGTSFDLQGGGSDLAFPHHEMSAALGQAATGHSFARHYVHVGMVGLDGEKMSKSLGNLELVSHLLTGGHQAPAIRLALLDHHYRNDWEWWSSDLERAEDRLARWREALAGGRGPAEPVIDQIRAALRHDLDTPGALTAVDEWAAGRQTTPGSGTLMAAALDTLLGIRV